MNFDLELVRLLATWGPIVFAVGVVLGYFGPLDHPGRKRK